MIEVIQQKCGCAFKQREFDENVRDAAVLLPAPCDGAESVVLDDSDQWSDGALFSFFFQAEDGIRDDLVTGVQTCALPILGCRWVTVDVDIGASRRAAAG